MKFDTSITKDLLKARAYLDNLSKSGSKVELKKIHPKRSTSQNSYLHVLFTLWGNEYGYSVDETKYNVKYALGYYDQELIKEGLLGVVSYHSTSKMDSKELTTFIEKFRDWSASTCGLYLPSADEYVLHQFSIDNDLENGL